MEEITKAPPQSIVPLKADANGASDGASPKTKTPPSAVGISITKRRKKRFKNWSIIGIILVVAGFAVWYFFFKGEAAQATFIRFAAVDKGDIVKSVSATGTLQATTTVQVGAQVSGRIQALHADFNTRVKKGDLVAELDPTFFEAAVNSAQANLSKANSDLEIAQRNEARNKELFSKNLIAKADLDITENALNDAKANVKQQQSSLEQAQVNLSYTKIHAPISGIVTQRSVDVGQTVAASLSAPVLFIIAEDLTEMEVQANVDEADVGQVKQGEDVSFTVDAFPGEKFHGIVKMVRLNPVIQSNVVTYTVVITAPNPDEKLFPGMTATVSIVNSSAENVLRIPVAATRFIPPGMENTAPRFPRDTTGMARNRSDTSHMRQRGGRSDFATIYRKAPKQKANAETPELEPVKIKTGISDGMITEVTWSDKPLNPGDSIAIGAITPSKAPANAPGANPFGTQRPGGGGGRGR